MSLIMDVLNRNKLQEDGTVQTEKKKQQAAVQAPPREAVRDASHSIPGIADFERQIIERRIRDGSFLMPAPIREKGIPWLTGLILLLIAGMVVTGGFYFWNTAFWKMNINVTPLTAPSEQIASLSTQVNPWEISAQVMKKNEAVFLPKEFVLEGVVLDKKPVGIINGRIVKVGDRIEGREVTVINERGVYLQEDDGKVTFLKN